jgi:uncharacterized protein (TIGR02145 family)
MKHYLNHTKILFVVFALIVHSLPAVVLSQEFKSLDSSKNRVVLNKVLPPSPSNLDRTVKVPLSFTVLPDGTVGEVIPLSKGDPSLEVSSMKTLKKWKFNPIEDNIIMKGEITFTFSPDGRDNYTAKEKTLTLTNNKSDDSMQEKYYSVNHHHWGDFMNSHAVWIDNGTLSYEGILYKMMFSTEILEKGIYNYEYSADDSEDVLFDGNNLNNYIDNQNSEKGKLYLHEGIHKIQVAMRNSVINKQFWRDNPAGFAFTLTNERGEIVFTTRNEKHCYKVMAAVKKSSEFNKQNIPDITIGNQVWMARNLDVDTFRNGDKLFHAKSSKDWDSSINHKIPAWAYYDNDSVKGKIYGRIYNRHVIFDPRGISPFGWRVPTNDDWDELKANLSEENERLIKSNNLWMKKDGAYEAKISKHDFQINQAGFNALPGGFRYGEKFWYSKRDTGLFGHIGKIAIWWTAPSQEFKDTVFSELDQISIDKPRAIVYSSNKLQSFQYHRGDGFYIRCIKEDDNDKNTFKLSHDSDYQSNDNNLDFKHNMKDGKNHVSHFQYTPKYPEFDYLYESFPEYEVPVPTAHTQKENASTSKDIMINRKEWIRLFEKGTYQNQIKKRLLDPTYPYDPLIRFRHKPL